MTDDEAAAELLKAAADLEAVEARLDAIHARLPLSSREDVMLLGEEEMDVSTEIRSVIECVKTDSIQPAIRDLKAAAAYRPSPKPSKGKQGS